MPKVILHATGKEYDVNQKDFDTWNIDKIAFDNSKYSIGRSTA